MTIKELYEWAKYNGCADYEITVECFDGYADESDVDIEEDMLEKHIYDVVMKCRRFYGVITWQNYY